MTDRLLKELLELKTLHNIDEEIFKRILHSLRKNYQRIQNEDAHILKTLFTNHQDIRILDLISLLLAEQLITLREVPSYLEFLPQVINNYSKSNLTNIVLAHKIFKSSKNNTLTHQATTPTFLTSPIAETIFLKDIYLFLNNIIDNEELIAKYFNGEYTSRQILENQDIPLEKRKIIFALINKKPIFFNNENIALIIRRLDIDMTSAIWTSKFLRVPSIRENEIMLKFIENDANIPLMCGITFVAFNSADLTLEELNTLTRLKSPKTKLKYLQELIQKHYLAKKSRAIVEESFASALGYSYDLYLKGEITEEEFTNKLSESNISPDIPRINF